MKRALFTFLERDMLTQQAGDTELTDTTITIIQFRNGLMSQIYSDASGNGVSNVEELGLNVIFCPSHLSLDCLSRHIQI